MHCYLRYQRRIYRNRHEWVGQEIEKVRERDVWVDCYSIKISKHKWEETDMKNELGYRRRDQNRIDRIRGLRYGGTYNRK